MRVHLQGAETPDLAALEPELLESRIMIQITPQMRIMVAIEPADFRRGIDGLARVCKDVLRHDPFNGWVFVFRNRLGHGAERSWSMTAKVFGFATSGCPAASSAGGRPARTHAATKTLAAHQLQVLLAAGNPEATQAAPAWRPVGPGGVEAMTCGSKWRPRSRRIALALMLSCPWYCFALRAIVTILIGSANAGEFLRLLALRRGHFRRAAVAGIIMPSETDDHRVGHGQAGRVLRRVEAKELDAEDYETIKAVIESYVVPVRRGGRQEHDHRAGCGRCSSARRPRRPRRWSAA